MKKIATMLTILSMATFTSSTYRAAVVSSQQIPRLVKPSINVELTTAELSNETFIKAVEEQESQEIDAVEETIEAPVPEKKVLYFTMEDVVIESSFEGNSISLDIPAGTHLESIQHEEGKHLVRFQNYLGWVNESSLASGEVWMIQGVLLANKGYEMSQSFNPGINPEAEKNFTSMKSDAGSEGIKLNVFSTFRSYKRQTELYGKYVRNHGQKEADTFSARPGHSEHQTGLSFDIGGANSNLWTSEKLGETKEGIWMAENSYKYGFILRYPKGKEHITGYKYEPWHFRYVGKPLAEEIHNSGLTLEEFFNVEPSDYEN